MAAAEYYNPGGASQGPPPAPASAPRPPNLAPPPNGPHPSFQSPPYPMSDAPPPYSPLGTQQRPHSQPPPGQRMPQQNYAPYNPNPPPNGDTHQYPPEKPQRPSTLQNMYRPSDFTSAHPPPPTQQSGYGPTTVAPGLSQVYGNQASGRRYSGSYPPGQSPNRPQRSRSSSRERRKYHNRPRPDLPRKKSSGVNTFLGAGGGAIIGDLIFPGLGTIGGAILGGVGGHEYGKKRASSNPNRTSNKRSNSNVRDYYEDDYHRGRKY